MKANFVGFKKQLRDLDKRDVQFIKGGEPPACHDAVRVSKLRKREKIKPGKGNKDGMARLVRTNRNRLADTVPSEA